MKVLLTGGSGNLGQTLVPRLLDQGDTPVILDVRAPRHLALRNISWGSRSPARATPITTIRAYPISTASPAYSPTNRQPGWRRSRAIGRRLSSAAFRHPRATSLSPRSAIRLPFRKAIGIVAT